MAETPSMDASKAFPSLFSLLLDASTPQPQQNFDSGRHNSVQTDTAQSAFLSSLGFESELSSFEPSMQSHYPVADCPSMQLRARPLLSQPMFFHSLPVSYQVRLSDLTLLSKKIRATSLQDILAPAQASNKEG
ncbi:hypothetical protein BDW22DRAFT_1362170 [Trametopsis cervina]|nr:hypothetical protein BDW22DRAFT_1362170 [Trametopsis cervina]